MGEPHTRHLPSADWVAFGIGVTCLFAQYLYAPSQIIVAVAVFAPSVLRELGLLRDGDEWTRAVMHRAGFHAALVAALFILLGYLVPVFGVQAPVGGIEPQDVFGGETLRKAVVGVFLISYLLQYWGGRKGTYRILLGVAVMNVAPILGFMKHSSGMMGTLLALALSAATLFVGLAMLVRRFPRGAGWVLLALCFFALVFALRNIADPRIAWGQISIALQAFLVLGVTGIALVRDPAQ